MKYLERISLTADQKATWDRAIRKVLKELPSGSTPADAAAELARRALLKDPEGNVTDPKAHCRSVDLVVYHRGREGKTWADGKDGRIEVDPQIIEEKVRAGARTGLGGAPGSCQGQRAGKPPRG